MRLDHLGERPVRDAFAVGQAPALTPVDELGLALDHREELGDEPALADARDADERDELGRSLLRAPAGARPRGGSTSLLASDERRSARTWRRRRRSASGPRSPPRRGPAPTCPSPRPRSRGSYEIGCSRRPIRRLVDEDPVHRRRRLKTGRRVHHVARSHALALRRTSAERDQRLPGRRPRLEPGAHPPRGSSRGSQAPRGPPAPDRPRAPSARRTAPSPRRR